MRRSFKDFFIASAVAGAFMLAALLFAVIFDVSLIWSPLIPVTIISVVLYLRKRRKRR
jgi:hypothetical protein